MKRIVTLSLNPETQNERLSPHFALKEFTKSPTAIKLGIKNIPPQEAVENLKRLCKGTLEPLREKLGLPIIITSGFRTKALNDMLSHSSERSQHMLGQAADFYVSQGAVQGEAEASGSKFKVQCSDAASSKVKVQGESRRELLIKAFRQILQDPKIDFDQLILYPTFIHVSYVSRELNRRKLTRGFSNGKYAALTRKQAMLLT